MTYLQLITGYLQRQGASLELIAVVEDYLKHAHPHDEPAWSVEFDDLAQAAVRYANSKQFRLRRYQGTLNARHKESLQQEADAIRRALRRHSGGARAATLERFQKLEKLIHNHKTL